MDQYEKQANDFLAKTGTEFKAVFLRNGKHFEDDETVRDIYEITLKRGKRSYSFEFGQSTMNSQYYQDKTIPGRSYLLDGSARTGNYRIVNLTKYLEYVKLMPGTPPTAYDVLACLTKYDPESFEDFCGEFGYNTDSRKAEKTYKAVVKEWYAVCALFADEEIELLREIQ